MSIRFRLKTWIYPLLLITLVLVSKHAGYAQDTVSTADVAFTPMEDSAATIHDSVVPAIVKAAVITPAFIKSADAATPKTLSAIFIAGLLGGFAAVLMPCIFPMLPMTVSFFTKSSQGKGAVGKAVTYGLSIIGLYVLLGLLITVLFGADALNDVNERHLQLFLFSVAGRFCRFFPGGVRNSIASCLGV